MDCGPAPSWHLEKPECQAVSSAFAKATVGQVGGKRMNPWKNSPD